MKKNMDILMAGGVLVLTVVLIASGFALEDGAFCFVTGVLSLIIFIFYVIGILIRSRQKEEPESSTGSKFDQFMAAQKGRILEWAAYMRNRINRTILICFVCVTASMLLIGFLAGGSIEDVLALHFPLGVIFGEGVGLLSWLAIKVRGNGKKIFMRTRKNLEKIFTSAGARDAFAEDYLEAAGEWSFEAKGKEALVYGALGKYYWTFLSGTGDVMSLFVNHVTRVDTFVDSGRASYGKYRGTYVFYTAKFFLRDEKGMVSEKQYTFPTEAGMDNFAQLLKRRVGDKIEVYEK